MLYDLKNSIILPCFRILLISNMITNHQRVSLKVNNLLIRLFSRASKND